MAAIAASCIMSCGSTDKPPDEAVQAPSTPPGGRRDALFPCEQAAPAVAPLKSYVDLQVPGTYRVDMIFDGGEWRPADSIAMPQHHATRLELANVADFPALVARHGERVRFTLEITSREIRQVSGRQQWRATYRARILEVCVPT